MRWLFLYLHSNRDPENTRSLKNGPLHLKLQTENHDFAKMIVMIIIVVVGDGEDDNVGESLLVCKTDLGYFYHKQMLVPLVMMAMTMTLVRGSSDKCWWFDCWRCWARRLWKCCVLWWPQKNLTLFCFCLYFVFGEIVGRLFQSSRYEWSGEMDSPHRVGQPAHCQYCHL